MRQFFGLVLIAIFIYPVRAQDVNGDGSSFRVYLDCQSYCDQRFVKEEFQIVDFLNERTQADVHIIQTRQSTAAGGGQYTLNFIGQRDYSALSDTLVYVTSPDATSDDRRRAFLHHMSIGLSRYLVRAGLSDKIVVSALRRTVEEEAERDASIEADPWNYWVFSITGSGWMNGQASSKSITRSLSFSANRTTEQLKVRFSGYMNDSRREFDTGDETIVSTTNSQYFSAEIVKSIDDHWSYGAAGNMTANSVRNTERAFSLGPAIEYDIYPYSESTRKLLTIQYNPHLLHRFYDELTIFALEEETILRHSLAIRLSLAQKWGSLTISSTLYHMLTNFDRSLTDAYNLSNRISARVRLFRGLSFNGTVQYERVRDQVDLRGNAATKEEILLQSVQLPTGYTYFINFGLTYRFGSLFNSVVNPRLN